MLPCSQGRGRNTTPKWSIYQVPHQWTQSTWLKPQHLPLGINSVPIAQTDSYPPRTDPGCPEGFASRTATAMPSPIPQLLRLKLTQIGLLKLQSWLSRAGQTILAWDLVPHVLIPSLTPCWHPLFSATSSSHGTVCKCLTPKPTGSMPPGIFCPGTTSQAQWSLYHSH